MLARRLATILPEVTLEEALETTKINSPAGTLPVGAPLVARRPFRAPHHTISDAGPFGGGSYPWAGEVSLAPPVSCDVSKRTAARRASDITDCLLKS